MSRPSMPPRYHFAVLDISQGNIDSIRAIATFATPEEALEYGLAHPEYRSTGHGWSGRVEYAVIREFEGNYSEEDGRPLTYPREKGDMFLFEQEAAKSKP